MAFRKILGEYHPMGPTIQGNQWGPGVQHKFYKARVKNLKLGTSICTRGGGGGGGGMGPVYMVCEHL